MLMRFAARIKWVCATYTAIVIEWRYIRIENAIIIIDNHHVRLYNNKKGLSLFLLFSHSLQKLLLRNISLSLCWFYLALLTILRMRRHWLFFLASLRAARVEPISVISCMSRELTLKPSQFVCVCVRIATISTINTMTRATSVHWWANKYFIECQTKIFHFARHVVDV